MVINRQQIKLTQVFSFLYQQMFKTTEVQVYEDLGFIKQLPYLISCHLAEFSPKIINPLF